MLGTIIIREIQEYIKSKRFIICLIVTFILVISTTTVNTKYYVRMNQNYLDAKSQAKITNIDNIVIYKKPKPLSIFIHGKELKLGNRVQLSTTYIAPKTTGYFGYRSLHYLLYRTFEVIDYGFIVKIVLSFFVIFLSFDAISKERERGTLALVLSNQISRSTLLICKVISGSIVIGVSLICATAGAFLIIVVNPLVSLNVHEFLKILQIFIVSFLYLMVFYCLSMLISVKSKSSSNALTFLVLAWIVIVILYPNLSIFITDISYSLPNRIELERKKHENSMTAFRVSRDKNSSLDRTVSHLISNNETAEVKYRVDRDFSNKLTVQATKALNMVMLSPSVCFDLITTRIAQTSIKDNDSFLSSLYQFWYNHVRYSQKDLEQILELTKMGQTSYMVRMKKAKEIPEFIYHHENHSEIFLATLPYILILFLYCVVCFASSYVSFLRKDIR